MQTYRSRTRVNKIIVAGGIALLLLYFVFDPAETIWMPQCVFHRVTGLQCMGCGAQRMAHALLHGNLVEAMRANMFLFLSLPFIGFMVWLEQHREKYPDLYRRMHSKWVIVIVAILLMVWLVVRNLMGI